MEYSGSRLSLEYCRIKLFPRCDNVFLLSMPVNSSMFLIAGYRFGSDEIITGIEMVLPGVIVDVVSTSHPVLGRMFFMGVGWVWMRKDC